ncbi:MAG: NYN domain-containing protein [Acidobacteriia bacterium]|nr:NYN domain-containing protein [Terriglobia bacterium]
MSEAAPPATTLSPEALGPVTSGIEELQKEIAGLRRERRKDLQEQGGRLDGLTGEVRSYRVAAQAAAPAPKSAPRRKGDPERVGVFVDVQNMYYAARQLKGKLDFDALIQAAVRDRRLIQATAYVVETKEIDQSGFIAMLEQRAIEVRRKTLKIRSDGSMKGDWDMEMALDILDAASRLDVVVLVSGDGDFTSLVNRVKGIGPRVEVIGFPRNTAKSLLEAADRFQPLDRKYMIRTGTETRPAAGPEEPLPTSLAPEPAPREEPAPAGHAR